MDIEQGIITYLVSKSVSGGRVYPLILPQNAGLPAVVVQRVSSVTDYVHEGASGLELGRFQFTAWAENYAAAKATAAAVIAALSGLQRLNGDGRGRRVIHCQPDRPERPPISFMRGDC